MKTKEDIFNLIKLAINLSGKIDDYNIRLSDSVFDRENLIGVYRIRKGIALRKENYKLAEQMHQLIIGFESYSGILLKGVTIDNKNYIGTFYLSEHWDKVIGYLESELDDDGNILN